MGRSSEDDKDAADNINSGTKKKTGIVCCKHGKPCEFATNDRQQQHRNKATDKDKDDDEDLKSEREKRAYENMPGPNLADNSSSATTRSDQAIRSPASCPSESTLSDGGIVRDWGKKRERDSSEYVNLMDLDSCCQEGDVPMESDENFDWDEHETISTVRSDVESMRLRHVQDMPTAEEDKDNNMDPTMTSSKTKSGRDQSDDQEEEAGTRVHKSPSELDLTERLQSRGMLPAMKEDNNNKEEEFENIDSAADVEGMKKKTPKNPSQMDLRSVEDKPNVFMDLTSSSKTRTENSSSPSDTNGRSAGSDPDVCRSRSSVTTVDTDSSQASLLDKINPKEQLLEFYIGQCTPTRAEQLFSSKLPPLGFRLYHRVEEGPELQAFLPLYIVHQRMTGHKEFRHIRILRCGKDGDRMRVDIEGEPQFQQLSQLITFYDIYASFDNNLEPFPKKQSASGEDD